MEPREVLLPALTATGVCCRAVMSLLLRGLSGVVAILEDGDGWWFRTKGRMRQAVTFVTLRDHGHGEPSCTATVSARERAVYGPVQSGAPIGGAAFSSTFFLLWTSTFLKLDCLRMTSRCYIVVRMAERLAVRVFSDWRSFILVVRSSSFCSYLSVTRLTFYTAAVGFNGQILPVRPPRMLA